MDMLKGKNNGPVKWDKPWMEAFKRTKKALCLEKILQNLDFTQPFVLQTDTSSKAMGAVVSQIMDSMNRPVAYASWKLNMHE